MIFKNNNKIANIYRGTLKISNVYRGGILVHTGEKPITYDGLTFTALETSTIKYVPSSVTTAQYSYNAVNWISADNVTLNLNKGDKVYFKGNITDKQQLSSYAKFTMTGKVSASGSIMSMQSGNLEDKSLKYNYEFNNLFYGCTSLVEAPELPATTLTIACYYGMFQGCSSLTTAPVLPATTLKTNCYNSMFYGCSSLTTAPVLHSTTLASSCYGQMFYGCTSLVSAPVLPATTLKNSCYEYMFKGCSSLKTVPKLPATTLDNYCYSHMFENCSSLTKAPELPATKLVNNCYNQMFYYCSKLNYIKALFTTEPGTSYTSSWVYGVAKNGTFVMNKDATWIAAYYKGVNEIPEGWTVETA